MDPERSTPVEPVEAPAPGDRRPWEERLREELVAAAVRAHARRTCRHRQAG